jgi:hypothetical protein
MEEDELPSFNPRTGRTARRRRRSGRRSRGAARRVRSRLRRARVRRPRQPTAACKVVPPYGRDNVTGWFIYRCGKGTLIVPAPRCLGPECSGAEGRGTRALGFAGDLGAGMNGSFRDARGAAGLRALTGTEIAAATAELGALKDSGAIGSDYWRAALSAVERRPERYLPILAPGVTRPILGQPIGQKALANVYSLVPPSEVGPSVREGCACTPRPPDGRDPVSGWFIYRVNGGVLLTPTWKCIAGGGSVASWLSMTWRNTLALFGVAPATPPLPVPELPPAPTTVGGMPEAPPPAPCEPDTIIGIDSGPFASGWYIVNRPGVGRLLVPNPNLCQ